MEYRRMTEVDKKQLSLALSRPNKNMEGSYFGSYRFYLLLLCLSFTSVVLTGCVGLAAPPAAPTVTLSASPASITIGASVTLTWTTTNAVTATINNGVGAVPPSGSATVTPTQ